MKAFCHKDRLLSKTYLQLMTVSILTGLVQPCNQFIDSILTGKFLGIYAMKAYALFLPAGSLVIALSIFFALGNQICCSSLIGNGRADDAGRLSGATYSTALVFSLFLAFLTLLIPDHLAVFLGADEGDSKLVSYTASYLQGYAIGLPATFLMQIMLPLMQIEGKKSLVTLMTIVVLIVNVAGDLLSLFIFGGGLFGMALATSFASIAGFLIALIYMLTSTKLFHFSLRKFRWETFKKISRHGIPALTYYGSIVIRTAFFNYLILTRLDGDVMAVMVVINSLATLIDAAIGGTGDAVLMLGGVLNGEKDKNGQRRLLQTSFVYGGFLLLLLMILTLLLATPIATMFCSDNSPDFIELASRAVMITSLYFVPDVLSCILKKYIQSVGRSSYISVTNVLCNVIYVCGAAVVLVELMGADGLFLSYTFCYVAILITHIIYAKRVSGGKEFFRFDYLLFIPDSDRISDENIMECRVHSLDECSKASGDVYDFCKSRGIDMKKVTYISLITEEVTTNSVRYGFKGRSNDVVIVKIVLSEEKVVLSIKDNCRYFDPLKYYEKLVDNDDPASCIGLKLIVNSPAKVSYSNGFSLNSLRIEI